MTDKFNPLTENKLGCAYKWSWSTIKLNHGTSSSCHRTDTDQIDPDTLDNFHNMPGQIAARKLMQQGEWPGHGCEYCKNIEKSGGISDRQQANSKAEGKRLPPELLLNNKAVHVSPTIVEVNFSNLCNMSCIYCTSEYSSVWEQEEKLYGITGIKPNKFVGKEYQQMVDKFFDWLSNNVESLAELHVLGGEPMIMPELDRMIDFLGSHVNPDLEFAVVTNLKIPVLKFASTTKKLEALVKSNALKSVKIIASLDCWGPQQEYIRTGLSLRHWEVNFSHMVHNNPLLNIAVHSSITGLSIKTMAELISKIEYYNQFRSNCDIQHSKNFVVDRSCLAPGIFPSGFFDDDFEKIFAEITNDYTLQEMQGYKLAIDDAPYNPALIDELRDFMSSLDSMRNTNWQQLFPWLHEFKTQ